MAAQHQDRGNTTSSEHTLPQRRWWQWGGTVWGLIVTSPLWIGAFGELYRWSAERHSDLYYYRWPRIPLFYGFSFFAAVVLLPILWASWHRTLNWRYFVVPPVLIVFLAIQVPAFLPTSDSSFVDYDFLTSTSRDCRDWYKAHQRFPANDAELQQAMRATIDKYRAHPTYALRGDPVQYQIVTETDASGPHLRNLSFRPGVLYYSVSPDLHKTWLTMTTHRRGDPIGTVSLLSESGDNWP